MFTAEKVYGMSINYLPQLQIIKFTNGQHD